MTKHSRSLLGPLCFLLAFFAPCQLSVAADPDWPYLTPELAQLMENVTFHASFDAAEMTPEMAEGPEYAPKVFGPRDDPAALPRYRGGLIGKALVLGTGGAVYPRAGNVKLEKRGGLAIWIKPEDWRRPRDGNCVFAMTSNATFYLERQGPDLHDDGRVRRHEGILYIAQVPGLRSSMINGGSDWSNGDWHLLVANWSWPTMELSVNGEPFQVRSLTAIPDEKHFGDFILGDRSGNPRGLMDEVVAFRRPLAHEEVRLLWQLGMRQIAKQQKAGQGIAR